MAFGNYQNNESSKQKSINTKAKQFFNDKGDVNIPGSTMVLGYWNGTLNIKLHPLLDESKRVGKNKYDYETEIHSILTLEKLFDLSRPLNTLYQNLKGGMEVSEFKTSFGVATKSGYIEIANASKYGGSENNLVLCIYGSIDAETRKAEARLIYVFNKSSYMTNYNPENGECDLADPFESEFGLFTLHVNESIKALTNAVAHSMRHTNMYMQSKTIETLNALALKSGIDVKKLNSYNSGNVSGNSSALRFGNNNSNDNNDNGTIENGGTVEDRLPM